MATWSLALWNSIKCFFFCWLIGDSTTSHPLLYPFDTQINRVMKHFSETNAMQLEIIRLMENALVSLSL